jgi:hypothetical protein
MVMEIQVYKLYHAQAGVDMLKGKPAHQEHLRQQTVASGCSHYIIKPETCNLHFPVKNKWTCTLSTGFVMAMQMPLLNTGSDSHNE